MSEDKISSGINIPGQTAGSKSLYSGPITRTAGMDNVAVNLINTGLAQQQVMITLLDLRNSANNIADQRLAKILVKCQVKEVFVLGNIEEFAVRVDCQAGISAFVTVPKIILLN